MVIIDFINVGYGDAILIRDEAAHFQMLVDCGDLTLGEVGCDSARISAANYLRQEGVKRLDLLVISHLHKDHCGGLLDLVEQVEVGELWVNYLAPRRHWGCTFPISDHYPKRARSLLTSLNVFLPALAIMERRGTHMRMLDRTQERGFLSDQLAVKVWAAEHSLFAKQDRLIWSALVAAENGDSDGVIDSLVSLGAFINQTSLCLQLQVGPTSVALTGDLSAATWAQFAMLPCSIIKLPHHGHKDSLSTDLIERLCPRYAVISVSHDRKDNRPHTSILALLKDHGVATLFTDAVDRPGFLRHRHQAVRFYLTEKGIDGVYFVTGHNQIELVFNEG